MLNLVNPQTAEEKLERLVRDIYTAAGNGIPDEARAVIKDLLLTDSNKPVVTRIT